MQVLLKQLTAEAHIPHAATLGSIGYDVTACSWPGATDPGEFDPNNYYNYWQILIEDTVYIPTGISIQVDPSFFAIIVPRSSLQKRNIIMSNSIGVIDSDFRGELKIPVRGLPGEVDFTLRHLNRKVFHGEAIAQLVFFPRHLAVFDVVTQLSETTRGNGGFGSTGR